MQAQICGPHAQAKRSGQDFLERNTEKVREWQLEGHALSHPVPGPGVPEDDIRLVDEAVRIARCVPGLEAGLVHT